jgi:hypothetical protein
VDPKLYVLIGLYTNTHELRILCQRRSTIVVVVVVVVVIVRQAYCSSTQKIKNICKSLANSVL